MTTTVEWIVGCGSASATPNPRFDNEADAVVRYWKEKEIPSYIGSGHRRQVSLLKVTTTIEELMPRPKNGGRLS